MDDVSDVEKQVERACQHYIRIVKDLPESWSALRETLCLAIAGKFKEEPLPRIITPPFPSNTLGICEGILNGPIYWVEASNGNYPHTFYARGPARSSKAAAIFAWNAVFAKRDER